MNVFVPATPNPSTGFLLFVPKSDVRLLDMSTEEAAKLIISGGIITPPERAEPFPPAQAEPGAVAESDISTAMASNVLEQELAAAEGLEKKLEAALSRAARLEKQLEQLKQVHLQQPPDTGAGGVRP